MKNMILSALAALMVLAVFSFAKHDEKAETLMIVTNEVKDFDTWKAAFESGSGPRSKMGIQVLGVYRAIDNPNVVTIVSSVSDIEAAKKFSTSPELKSSMEKAGVISKPEIKMIKKAF
ncbi:MAG: hypothetical protein K0R65_2838 [Crocinitomicaceae bacterium]|jgi:quinol monooxygenase YgiN|nr:hypothetical protein [Crocinitomicaceae bacterium]